jgi:GNAT superfamily N-acetyltransferase
MSKTAAGTHTRVEERKRGDRRDLLPILAESFSGVYLWHARRILLGRSAVLAAERHGSPVGLAMMKMLSPAVGYVYYLAVLPAERRNGIGGALLDGCLAWLASRGAGTTLAAVTRGNVPSERLIASRGFTPRTFWNLILHFGPAAAALLWLRMTVAPGERVSARGLLP